MFRFFNGCCGRTTDAVATQDNTVQARANQIALSSPVNPTDTGVIQRTAAATGQRATTLRLHAEIEVDLANWRRQRPLNEQQVEVANRIRTCVQNSDTSLCLSHLDLDSLPNSVGKIAQLQSLAIGHNALSVLPDNLCALRQLKCLQVNHNQLANLPHGLGDLVELRTLHANDNRLAALPQSIGALRNLLDLQLQNNRLRELPTQLNALRIGTTVLLKNNLIKQQDCQMLRQAMVESEYHGPAIFLDRAANTGAPADHQDPFAMISDAKRIEALLEAAANMEDGRLVEPRNFDVGFRNLNRKDCLLMALEFALDSHRNLIPAICHRLISEMPGDTKKFLIKGVNIEYARVKAWSQDQGLPVQKGTARQVVDVEVSMHESSDQNVHDNRVRGNFVRQFQLISDRVAVPLSSAATNAGILSYLSPAGQRTDAAAVRDATAGLQMVMERTDVARGFNLSPADTLAMVWTHIEHTDDALKVSLKDALKNRLIEIGRSRICGLGLTERLIDIPTAVNWSVTNAISQEQLNIEIAQMAGGINDEYETMFGADADIHRAAATASGDTQRLGDLEMRINEVKRDMFFAKAKVELVLLRDLDEAFVRGQISNIFPSGDGMRVQI